jgi:enoyl-CoA hydratase
MAIELEANCSIAMLRLNKRPVNALDEADLRELITILDQLEDDPGIKVILFTSALKDIFCAGGDLKYWPRLFAHRPDAISTLGQSVFERIERSSKPSIAAIRGQVIGDGLSLALACDLRLASLEATFLLPEISYGFIPGWGTIGRLIEAVGTAPAAELLFLGEQITARQAHLMGLVNRLASPSDLIGLAETLAGRIATQPPRALRYAKAAIRGASSAGSTERKAWEARCFAAVWGGPEWRQGLDRLFNTPAVTDREEPRG